MAKTAGVPRCMDISNLENANVLKCPYCDDGSELATKAVIHGIALAKDLNVPVSMSR